jgi:CheY-like chemotaxis protein
MEFKSPVKALIVEDNKVHTLILSMILCSFHVEITVAENGKEAVDLFLEGKKFDIVFCDNEMPIMAGPEVF